MATGGRAVSDAAADVRAHVVVRRERFTVDVAFEVGAGETVAIMGPSGAGKSTILGALAGLVPLDAGEVVVDERMLDRVSTREARGVHIAPMHRGVVLLGQDARLFPHLTARENVAFGPRAARIARATARDDADAWLARVGLAGAGPRRPDELSGGEQQRVAVARALAASPRVVLLDEPLVALDAATASDIRAMLRTQLAGVTTVAVTHDAIDAAALADRLIVVESGGITQTGPVRDVLASPGSGFVAAIAGVNRLVGVAAGGAWEAPGVRLETTDAASHSAADVDGAPLAAVFRPGDVRLGAGAGNVWTDRVVALEPTPAGVRVRADHAAVDVGVFEAAGLGAGSSVTLSIDPAHVRFVPIDPAG
jgi:molybdate transport system ATP-binding protein